MGLHSLPQLWALSFSASKFLALVPWYLGIPFGTSLGICTQYGAAADVTDDRAVYCVRNSVTFCHNRNRVANTLTHVAMSAQIPVACEVPMPQPGSSQQNTSTVTGIYPLEHGFIV